jgi:hypothetical protein
MLLPRVLNGTITAIFFYCLETCLEITLQPPLVSLLHLLQTNTNLTHNKKAKLQWKSVEGQAQRVSQSRIQLQHAEVFTLLLFVGNEVGAWGGGLGVYAEGNREERERECSFLNYNF